MYIILGIVAAVALGGIIHFFFSKESSRNHKLAALVALILSGLTLGICGIVLFVAAGIEEEENPYSFNLVEETAPASSKTNALEFILFLIILLAAFGFIIYLGIKDRKKRLIKEAINDMKDSDFSSLDDF